METIKFPEKQKKAKMFNKIKYLSAIILILGAQITNGQENIKTNNKQQISQEESIQEIKNGIQKYVAVQDQEFFNWALTQLQEEEYIRQNINAFMNTTIGTLPGEEQIIWKIIAINSMFPDSLKNTDYIMTTPRVDIEFEKFSHIYRNWWFDYKKYLINKEKISSQKEKKRLPNILKKDPKKIQKPKYAVEENIVKNYLAFARETVKKDFPLDEKTMNICINYIEEDSYIKANIEKFLAKTVGTLPEKEKGIAILEAISIITKWLKQDNIEITTTFTERNHVKLSPKTDKEIGAFLDIFTERAINYINYSKIPRF